VLSDLKLALRTLRRSPGFAIPAILTLALGIGANTAMFSIIDAMMLRPLPFRDPDRLVLLWQRDDSAGRERTRLIGGDQVERWSALSHSFEALGGYTLSRVSATGAGGPERLDAMDVSGDLMRVLGYQPLIGRSFAPSDLRKGAPGVVILGQAYWQRRFGGQSSALGRTLSLDGVPYTIIGVLPGAAQPVLPHARRTVDVWAPAHLSLMARLNASFVVCTGIGRLKQGVPVAQANAELRAIHERIRNEKRSWKRRSAGASALRDHVASDLRPALLVLFGAVGCVLLIATVNVANLQLARAAARQRETGVRALLGGGRARLLRGSLTESAMAGLAGGAVGLLLSQWMLKGILALWPGRLEQFGEIRLDWPVLLFAFGASLATGLLFGLLPAWQASRTDLNAVVKDAGLQGKRRGAFSPANLLVVAEVALAVVLMIGSGLLVRTFAAMRAVDPGFRTENAVVFSLPMVGAQYAEPAGVAAFADRLLERLRSDPRIDSAGMTNSIPLGNGFVVSAGFSIAGRAVSRDEMPYVRTVTPGYFQAMGLALRKGRYLSDEDRAAMVMNETAARRYFGGSDPVGLRADVWDWKGLIIAGVVADLKNDSLTRQAEPEFYLPLRLAGSAWIDLLVRTRQDPGPVIAAVRNELLAADPNLATESTKMLEDVVGAEAAEPRFRATLLGLFAGLAAVLAAVGVFGVVSYSVTQRTREFGVRVALGADRTDVLAMVVRRGVLCAGAGLVVGLGAAAALVRVLRGMLFGVKAYDPTTFAGVAAAVLAVAAAAAWIPARRATSVDPIVALRYE
jgi:predicted permease